MTGHKLEFMTGHDYTFSEALKISNCSESTLRRKLQNDGSRLGATKLARGWRIPIETLESLGVVSNVTGQDDDKMTGHDRSQSSEELNSLRNEVERLRTDNAVLRERLAGLESLLAERGKVIALLEARPRHWWQRWSGNRSDAHSDPGLDSSFGEE